VPKSIEIFFPLARDCPCTRQNDTPHPQSWLY